MAARPLGAAVEQLERSRLAGSQGAVDQRGQNPSLLNARDICK